MGAVEYMLPVEVSGEWQSLARRAGFRVAELRSDEEIQSGENEEKAWRIESRVSATEFQFRGEVNGRMAATIWPYAVNPPNRRSADEELSWCIERLLLASGSALLADKKRHVRLQRATRFWSCNESIAADWPHPIVEESLEVQSCQLPAITPFVESQHSSYSNVLQCTIAGMVAAIYCGPRLSIDRPGQSSFVAVYVECESIRESQAAEQVIDTIDTMISRFVEVCRLPVLSTHAGMDQSAD